MVLIDSPSQLASVLKSYLAKANRPKVSQQNGELGEIESRSTRPKLDLQRSSQNELGRNAGKLHSFDLQGYIASQSKIISADDPERRRKTFRIFIESLLIKELGGEVATDAGFTVLVDQVISEMESNNELRPKIEQAVDLILAPA